ncbi:hypothetical protein GJ744_004150 [Endocarpon pusillum]|uniref:Dephospho-CoA kinase n=1 Tax=Endocarpon pusillum TaxID=364733 RepID=A0A8H7AP00_9EURO|nr:hypothetical protein GJ744_004150 [Endocarpon pusillum]
MLLLGLTGSIATGKSTVSAILTSPPHSLPLIDADLLARQAVEPGTKAYHQIITYFGPSTPDLLLRLPPPPPAAKPQDEKHSDDKPAPKGRPLNRAALGRRVFGDTEAKKRDRAVLNRIIHPAVRRAMFKALLYCYVRGCWAVVLDVPLLFESGWDRLCASVVVVAVRDPELQIRRLLERDRAQGGGMTPQEATERVRSQWDVRLKAERCLGRNGAGVLPGFLAGKGGEEEARGLVIWNDGDKAELRREVGLVMDKVRRKSPRWWSWVCLLVPPVGFAAASWQLVRNLLDGWAWERRRKMEKAKL